MSRESVEVVRRGCEAWARGDFGLAYSTWHSDIEWDTTHFEGWVDGQVYSGAEEVASFLEEWAAGWDSHETVFTDFFDAGDTVVVFNLQRMVGRESRVPVEMHSAQIYTVRDGKVARIENYSARDEALEAAGIS